ncbi:hypothetical protein GS682_25025 [Nostoc sp. B(2019)]|nr:hypothetical protein [Nostoc sp. B(2019)]
MGLSDQNHSVQEALEKLRTAAASASAAQKIAQRDYEQAQAKADEWVRRYQLALKEGHEDLARQAQFQKERYQAIASRLKNLVGEQTPQVDAIKRSLTFWESKVSEAQNEVLSSTVNIGSATSAFEHIENKFLKIEAPIQEVSQSFISFEDEDVNAELQRLKEELLLPSKPQDQVTGKKDTKVILVGAIRETQKAVKSAVLNQEGIQKDYEKAQEEAKYCNKKAHIALKNNDENLAFQAILGKTVYSKIAIVLQTQFQQQKATVTILRQNLIALENILETLGKPHNQDSIPNNNQTISDSSNTVIDAELGALRKELDQL